MINNGMDANVINTFASGVRYWVRGGTGTRGRQFAQAERDRVRSVYNYAECGADESNGGKLKPLKRRIDCV